MHIELAELLRCPVPHEPSALVVAAHRMESRVLLDGVLGCPVCGASFAIVNGVARFGSSPATAAYERIAGDALPAGAFADLTSADTWSGNVPPDDATLRMAAMLNASEPHDTVALLHVPPAGAVALQRLVPVRAVVTVDQADQDNGAAAAALRAALAPLAVIALDSASGALPLADGALAGVYLARYSSGALLPGAVAALRVGGRMAAPATCDIPPGMSELVRDAEHWVAIRDTARPHPQLLTQLRRRYSTPA